MLGLPGLHPYNCTRTHEHTFQTIQHQSPKCCAVMVYHYCPCSSYIMYIIITNIILAVAIITNQCITIAISLFQTSRYYQEFINRIMIMITPQRCHLKLLVLHTQETYTAIHSNRNSWQEASFCQNSTNTLSSPPTDTVQI